MTAATPAASSATSVDRCPSPSIRYCVTRTSAAYTVAAACPPGRSSRPQTSRPPSAARIGARLVRSAPMSTSERSLTVIGAGYVGLVSAVGLARLGRRVHVVETGATRLAALRAGHIPIHEDGLQEGFEAAVATGRLDV